MIYQFISCIYWLCRPMYKWILRKTTGKCELLRITSSVHHKYERTNGVGEYSCYFTMYSFIAACIFEVIASIWYCSHLTDITHRK